MTTTKPITTRRTARAAARVHAEHDLYETIRDAGRDAMQSGESVDDAERETARNIAAHPGGASEAWCNAGASRIVGIPALQPSASGVACAPRCTTPARERGATSTSPRGKRSRPTPRPSPSTAPRRGIVCSSPSRATRSRPVRGGAAVSWSSSRAAPLAREEEGGSLGANACQNAPFCTQRGIAPRARVWSHREGSAESPLRNASVRRGSEGGSARPSGAGVARDLRELHHELQRSTSSARRRVTRAVTGGPSRAGDRAARAGDSLRDSGA